MLRARRALRALDRIADGLERQTLVLARLADVVAPLPPTIDPETVRADTGVSHVDRSELALVLDYVRRTEEATGHTPSDDEILTYLADEATIDLHQRLLVREREIDRLGRQGQP